MITLNEVSASSYCAQWQSINWKYIEQKVLKLQMRIAKSTREGNQGKVKALQWILTHSKQQNCLLLNEYQKIKAVKHQELTASSGTPMPVVWLRLIN